MDFEYNDERAADADKAADKLTEQGPYVGQFDAVTGFKLDSGSEGLNFVFRSPGTGTAEFRIYTKSKEGKETFGVAQVDAIMYLLGLKRLKSTKGPVLEWVDGPDGKRAQEEVEGDTFPDLCNKPIGVVLQRERYSKQNGGDAERFNLYGLFQPETKLMMSELREKKTTPVKLDRLLKGLKVKDQRRAQSAEPAQPAIGAEGGY